MASIAALGQGPKPQLPPKEHPQPAKASPVPATTHELTKDDLQAFLDGLMPLQLGREDIAGAVITVAKGGNVLFGKGYGYSDVEKKSPVSFDATLFRPGSVSKLFTWTAVMQQVEQGKLDLDRDVNDYLDFKIPVAYSKPVTLRDIMTHTPGFEESVQELFVKEAKDLTPLGNYLKTHMPKRIYPPRTIPAYSNYGATLAGYIVQRVSGQPFDDYIEEHIFKPLGIAHSTFRQPLPASLSPLMSKGYDVASDPAKPFEFVEAAPAGSSAVTASDMTRFMIAHLQNGTFQNAQILNAETTRLMHTRQFGNVPDMNGMALGFYEETRNGHRIIGHAGDTGYFHSDLHLIPDADLGFFISYNSAGKGESNVREALWYAFLDRYFPYKVPAATSTPKDIDGILGRYMNSRRSQTTILKIGTVMGEPKVSRNSDDTISVEGVKAPNGKLMKFRQIGPLMFRDVDGQSRIAFTHDYSGRLMFVTDFPVFVFQKASLGESTSLYLPMIIGALIVLALTLLLWPIGALIRRHYGRKLELTREQRRLRILVRIVCALEILFIAGFLGFFSMAEKDIGLLSPKFNALIRAIQVIGWLGVLGTIAVLFSTVRSWQDRQYWLWSKLGDSLTALACLGFVWFVFAWNMLHWSLKY